MNALFWLKLKPFFVQYFIVCAILIILEVIAAVLVWRIPGGDRVSVGERKNVFIVSVASFNSFNVIELKFYLITRT